MNGAPSLFSLLSWLFPQHALSVDPPRPRCFLSRASGWRPRSRESKRTHSRAHSVSFCLSTGERADRKVTGERAAGDIRRAEREREAGRRYSAVPSLQEAGSDFSARSTRSRELKSAVSTFTFSSYTTRPALAGT